MVFVSLSSPNCFSSFHTLAVQEAADQALGVGGGSGSGVGEARPIACRVLYRLAHYADGLYRNVVVRAWACTAHALCPLPPHLLTPHFSSCMQAQKASPEHQTAMAVLAAKRRQMEEIRARLAERVARGEAKVDRKAAPGGFLYLDRESRLLEHHLRQMGKPVKMDEEEQQVRGWWEGGGAGGGRGCGAAGSRVVMFPHLFLPLNFCRRLDCRCRYRPRSCWTPRNSSS